MSRTALAVSLTLAAALAALAGSTTALSATSPPPLEPQTLLNGALSAPGGTQPTPCHRAYMPNRAGVATRSVDVSGPGQVTVRLAGTEGDWDVAVFDATGRALAADASPDAQEVAIGYTAGGRLDVQACRRSGTAAAVPATLEFAGSPPRRARAGRRPTRPSSSASSRPRQAPEGPAARARPRHDRARRQADASASCSTAPRMSRRSARPASAGACSSPTSPPQSRQPARRRRRATPLAPPAPTCPSGRDTYRTLADYNAELKALADDNPGLVRLITLPNKTWLGKDVLGVEITENVTRNDGKPAFLNLGVHHAREWPSGEHAMEWAIELINGFKSGDAARDEHRPQQPQHRRPDRQPGRLRGLAQRRRRARRGPRRVRRRHRLPRRRGRDRRRVPAQELPPSGRLGGRQLHDVGRPGRERRRPEPQLRRPVGRPGRRPEQPARPDLPRPRPVLRARDAQHPVRSSRATR